MKLLLIIITLSWSFFAFASEETYCSDIQLEGASGERVYVGIKRYDGLIFEGDTGMITVSGPGHKYEEFFSGVSLNVLKMTVIKESQDSVTYAVELEFPYNKNLTERFNNKIHSFFSVCEVFQTR